MILEFNRFYKLVFHELFMRNGVVFLWIVGLLFGLVFVSGGISSGNYSIESLVVSNGGDDISSGSFGMGAIVGMISGALGSASYLNDVGFYYASGNGSNVAPNNVVPSLISVDGLNLTTSDLNCSGLISDSDGDDLNVSVRWYRDGVLNLTVDYDNSYSNGTLFWTVLGSGNTSKGEVWNCSLRVFDGGAYSGWENSSGLEILNSLPTVSLVELSDWNSTTNRTPRLSWNSNDEDGDSMIYEIRVNEYQYSGAKICNDDISDNNLNVESFVFSSDLICLYDDGYYYNWSVRASDDSGASWGDWSSVWHFNVTAEVSIILSVSDLNFGSMGPGDVNDTSNVGLNPFVLENDGNVGVNVSLNSSALWTEASGDSSYYRFKVDNVSGEEGSFDWVSSVTNWLNVPITGNVVGIAGLNYSDSGDSAEVDIFLEVPANENPGVKSATIIFTGGLA